MSEKVTPDGAWIDLSEEEWEEARRRAQGAKDRLSEAGRAMAEEIGKRLTAEDEQFRRDRAETNELIRSIPQPSAEVLGRLLRDPEEKAERRREQLEAGVWRAEVEATRAKEARDREDGIQQVRELPAGLRAQAIGVHVAESGLERHDALKKFARSAGKQYTGGRPANEQAQQRARAAYTAEWCASGKVEAAVAAAMKAGGFKSRGYVLELRRRQGWDDDS